MTIKAKIKDGIYIPIKYVDEDVEAKLRKRFERDHFVKEATCEKCEYFTERVCDVCDNCPNYAGRISMFKTVTVKEKDYLRTPFGDRSSLKKIFGKENIEFVDKTDDCPMQKLFKFTGKLYDYQKLACKDMLAVDGGILKSAPRTGKTVMATYTISKLGQKTVILAAQKDWLDNFYETFVGGPENPPMTDIKKKRIGFPKTLEEVEKFDVCLFTYQKFLKPKGKKMLKKIRRLFGVMVVDEVQTASAPEFAQVINSFVCGRKYGLSGTPERKDTKHWIAEKLVGKVFHETKAERWVPTVEVTWTDLGGKMPQTWVHMVRKIEADPARLKLIAKTALKDVRKGHMVLIPFQRVEVIKALTLAINKMAGENICESFFGGTKNRKELIQRARNYETKIIVGQFRLLSTGINIPRASALYEVTPASNPPKAEQRFSRVLTPYKNKPMPLIRYFLDDVDVRRNCIKSEFFKVLWPMFRPKFDAKSKEEFFGYMSKKKVRKGVNDYVGSAI
jgi:superfamily II DNA or RNA helicase